MADILLVEDETVLRRSLAKALEREGHTLRAAMNAEEALALIAQGPPDLLITDQRLPAMSGSELLVQVKAEHPEIPVIVITAHGTIEDAVAAMRAGAADYLRKPVDVHELQLVVMRCLDREGLKRELAYYRERDLSRDATALIVGSSPAMSRLRDLVRRLGAMEKRGGGGPTILLTGETGTGKGLIARSLHQVAPHHDAPFIEVNCTALPANLLEAELMGYEKGSFTDAAAAKPGLFEAAEGGTIFFDEIGHMTTPLQAKLLKVIDEKKVRRLGSTRDRTIHCTILTATHMNLEAMVAKGDFLPDLFHRINVVKLEVPPLRDRDGDIEALADYFLALHAAEYGMPIPTLTEPARRAILAYSWPGNVRELSHTIERALVMSSSQAIDVEALGIGGSPAAPAGARVGLTESGSVEVDFRRGPVDLEKIEIELMRRAMEHTQNNQVQSARLLGLSRDAFRYRAEKYGLL